MVIQSAQSRYRMMVFASSNLVCSALVVFSDAVKNI